ncbi:MAG: hypothetical protein WBW31_11540 [Candidatus Sulfotelmatobacter sp.]
MIRKSSILASKFKHDRQSRPRPRFRGIADDLRDGLAQPRNAIPENRNIGAMTIQDKSNVEMVRAHLVLFFNPDGQRAGANDSIAFDRPRFVGQG